MLCALHAGEEDPNAGLFEAKRELQSSSSESKAKCSSRAQEHREQSKTERPPTRLELKEHFISSGGRPGGRRLITS